MRVYYWPNDGIWCVYDNLMDYLSFLPDNYSTTYVPADFDEDDIDAVVASLTTRGYKGNIK